MGKIFEDWLNSNKSYVKQENFNDWEDSTENRRYISNWYFVTADGTTLFIKAKTRGEAQELLDAYCIEWAGKKGHYTLRTARDEKNKSGSLSCTGTATRVPKKN